MKKKITRFKWLVAMLLLVTAMVMPSAVWAQESTVTFTAKEGTVGFSDNESFDKLIDGKYTSKDGTKWCLSFPSEGAYIIFSASERIQLTGYSIVTGNDNASNSGRNPQSWAIYGCNDASADRGSESWVLIDEVTNDTKLEDLNYKRFDFTLSNPLSEKYQYFKMEITATKGASVLQMSELILTYSTCNHQWLKTDDVVAPTCTEGGYDVYQCSVCQLTKKESNNVAALGHQWVSGTVVAPTCTKDGYTPQTCSRCQAEQKIDIVKATGHQWGTDDICDVCSADNSTLSKPQNGDGSADNPYQIGTAGELYWFAGLVNGDASVCTGGVSQNKSANAVLTANITVNKDVLNANGQPNGSEDAFRKWTPIGQYFSKAYRGTFDGQGHTISGLWHWWSTDDLGLFGNNEGTIKNLGVVDSYLSGHDNVGGVCGRNGGSLTNCYNTGPIYGVDYIGGVCGMNSGSLTNCYNTGNVRGYETVGGVCGGNPGTINNCYNTGTVSGNSYVGGVCGQTSETITNCYYLSGTATDGIGYIEESIDVAGSAESKTTTQFTSGEVCYLLNGSRSEGTEENPLAWYQNISSGSRDTYPVLTGTGTNTVYQVKILCGGTDDVGKAYSNTNKDITVEHILIGPAVFNSGKKIYSKICQREGCGKTLYYADAAGTIKATPNAEETAFAVASYTLADATAYNSEAEFTVTSLAYKRKFYDDKWMAVYVPFAIDCSKLETDYEMATINNFHEYEQEDGTYKVVLEVKRVTKGGTIPALTPCLMRMKTAPAAKVEKTLTFENAEFSAAADKSIDCSSVTRYYQFFGTLNGKTGLTAGTDFVLNAGKLYNTSESTVLLPQRWYLSATDRTSTPVETAAMLRSISIKVIGDGEATGIEDIHVNTELGADASGSTGIYDLQGRKINSEPTKGMYIKNGKKYIK